MKRERQYYDELEWSNAQEPRRRRPSEPTQTEKDQPPKGDAMKRLLSLILSVIMADVAIRWPPIETLPFYSLIPDSLCYKVDQLQQFEHYPALSIGVRCLLVFLAVLFMIKAIRQKERPALTLPGLIAAFRLFDILLMESALTLKIGYGLGELVRPIKEGSVSKWLEVHPLLPFNILALLCVLVYLRAVLPPGNYFVSKIKYFFRKITGIFRKVSVTHREEYLVLHVISMHEEAEFVQDLKRVSTFKKGNIKVEYKAEQQAVWVTVGNKQPFLLPPNRRLVNQAGYCLELHRIEI